MQCKSSALLTPLLHVRCVLEPMTVVKPSVSMKKPRPLRPTEQEIDQPLLDQEVGPAQR